MHTFAFLKKFSVQGWAGLIMQKALLQSQILISLQSEAERTKIS